MKGEWLLRPAPEAARHVALELLEEASAARRRLRAGDADGDALHDFRVAVRRLRSWIRAFRPQLEDTLRGRARRRLGRVADATSASRDLEVLLALVPTFRPRGDAERDALQALRADLEQRQARVRADVDGAAGLFDEAREELLVGLSAWMQPVRSRDGSTEPLALVLAARLTDQVAALGQALEDARTVEHQAEAHAARIAGKRLRYMLEPLARRDAAARACVRRLKLLQDVLGDMHDAHVLELEAAELAAGAQPPAAAAQVVQRIGRRVRSRHQALRRDWLEGGARALARDVLKVAGRLRDLAGEGLEHERKFLLSALPARARRGRRSLLEQGWLPGEAIVERLRRERTGSRTKHWRTIKAGRGVSRLEAEEAIPASLFRSLWPLTRGRRVRKERYFVRDGARTWEIDRFLDRDLVLAEVELPSADAVPEIPAWLAPHVVRDVTGEDEYVNRNLAR